MSVNEEDLRSVVLDIIGGKPRSTIDDVCTVLRMMPRYRISDALDALESEGRLRCTGWRRGRKVWEACP